MKTKSPSQQSGRANPRAVVGLLLLLVGVFLGLAALGSFTPNDEIDTHVTEPVMGYLSVFRGDVRDLPQVPQADLDLPEFKEPYHYKQFLPEASVPDRAELNIPMAPMPAPIQNFPGLSFGDNCVGGPCGSGIPPDTNGDVGPNHYIQAVNSAFAIYNKTGTRLASFTENQLFAQSGNPCDGNSRGDPIVLYDPLANRWVLTNIAFAVGANNTPLSPFYQCIAVSATSDPVSGGWNRYGFRMDTGNANQPPVNTLNDYPKFGIWTDCLYYSANGYNVSTGQFTGGEFASVPLSAMYAGQPVVTMGLGYAPSPGGTDYFTMVPSNISGPAGALPVAGTPNFYVQQSRTAFNFRVRKFTAGANCGGGGSLGVATTVSQTSYSVPGAEIVPQPPPATSSNTLDTLGDRIMQKVQYRRVGSAESLWLTHTFGSGPTGSQWAQIDVTGGTIGTNPLQQQKYDPANGVYRWMSSIAADKNGNVALGYSSSGTTTFPNIAYSGRLASDTPNMLPQTETQLVAGNGSQVNNCGNPPAPCHRWGDYSSMSVDPADGCTFWYTNQYYTSQAGGNSGAWSTRIGSFKFPLCVASAVSPDFNNDGSADIIWQNNNTGQHSIWLMNGTVWNASQATLLTIPPGQGWQMAGTGDFNRDNNVDILWENTSTGQHSIWLMNGTVWNGSQATLLTIPPAQGWRMAGTGDFDRDGNVDIVWQNFSTGQHSIWLMNGTVWNGSQATLLTIPPGQGWQMATTGDFNRDGNVDIVWENISTGQHSIWLMNGTVWDGSQATLLTIPPAQGWRIAGASDFNRDGNVDILWQNFSTGQHSIWLMNGTVWNGSQAALLTIPPSQGWEMRNH